MVTHLYLQALDEEMPNGLYIKRLTDNFQQNVAILEEMLSSISTLDEDVKRILEEDFISTILNKENFENLTETYDKWDIACEENCFGSQELTIWIGVLNLD